MALSQATIDEVLAEVALSGIEETKKQIEASYVEVKMVEAKETLDLAIGMSVKDWDQLDSFLEAGVSTTQLYPLKEVISNMIAKRDSSELGVLMVQFFSAAKKHLG